MEQSWVGERAIIHADMDSFFASVEILDAPHLSGSPVIVGGTGPRGVVAAASYEARVYGVRSAMPMSIARTLCPRGVFLDGRFSRYREMSGRFIDLLKTYTEVIEPIGLDEAFIDVSSGLKLFGHPAKIAGEIRRRVLDNLGLSVCLGVSTRKQISKLASKLAKPQILFGTVNPPRGVVVVPPGNEQIFLDPINVKELWGVGPKTYEKLIAMGIHTIGDLNRAPKDRIIASLGKSGVRLLGLADRGGDDPVVAGSKRKSLGREQTYITDLTSRGQIDREFVKLADSVAFQLNSMSLKAKTVSVKIRFSNFTTVTRSVTLAKATDSRSVLQSEAWKLFPKGAELEGVRLLGISVSSLDDGHGMQLLLDDATDAIKIEALSKSVMDINNKFGQGAVAPASLIDGSSIESLKEDQQRWGPSGRQ